MNLAFEHLEHPLALMFAVPAVLWAFVLVLAARAPLSGWGRWLLGAARASLLVALLFVIAEPSRRVEGPVHGRLEVLLDRSRSLGPAQRRDLVTEADRRIRRAMALDPEQGLQVLAFAGEAVSLYDGKAGAFDIDHWQNRLDALDEDSTLEPLFSRLRPGLASLRSGREDGRDTVCLIFTDGALEPPLPASGLQTARHYLLTPNATVDGSRRLLALELPESLDDETPLHFRLSYEAGEPLRAPLEVLIDGDVVLGTVVDLVAGTGQWQFGGDGVVLPAGIHRVLVRGALDDDEPLDDRIGGALEVHMRRRPVYVDGSVSTGRDPALFRALEAQGIDMHRVTPASLALALSEPERVSAVILDRVSPFELDADVSGTLIALVEAGRGLIVFPGPGDGELVAWNEHPLATLLPLAGLPPPPPAPEDETPPPEVKEPPKKLDDPDPNRARKEVVDAPTLSLLLVIDKSASMKEGSRLHFAKLGAQSTVRRLHPEDRVGVLSYDSQPIEVVPMQAAKHRDRIERAIERIEARGSTDIKAALELAGRTLGRETSAVKTVVLLSDGETPPFNIRAVCEELVAAGISVNTIGVGSRFDWSTLTQIAKYGRGTGPIPAYNASQIPSVMVDVASKIMTENKTRSIDDAEPPGDGPPEDDRIIRPENLIPDSTPRRPDERTPEELLETDPEARVHPLTLGRPTVYLDEIPWNTAPPLRGRHLVQDKPGTWVSLRVDERLPLVAHWSRGEGRVIMAAVPSEGVWAEALTLWDGYAAWMTQMLRFVEQARPLSAMDLAIQVSDQQLRVRVHGARTNSETADWTFRVDDAAGMVPFTLEELAADEFLLTADAPWRGEFLDLQVNGFGANDELQRRIAIHVPPPWEVRHRGIDLRRLETWRATLDAEIVSPALRTSTETVPSMRFRQWTDSQRAAWIPWLLLLLLPELLLKRWLRHDD